MAQENSNQERVEQLNQAVKLLTGSNKCCKIGTIDFYQGIRDIHRDFAEALSLHGDDFGDRLHLNADLFLLRTILENMEKVLEA